MWKFDSKLLILASTNFNADSVSSLLSFEIISNASYISSEYLSAAAPNVSSQPSVFSFIIDKVSFNS